MASLVAVEHSMYCNVGLLMDSVKYALSRLVLK